MDDPFALPSYGRKAMDFSVRGIAVIFYQRRIGEK
jgi:hypothetical protein